MSITINTRAYTADLAQSPNVQPYVGAANSLSVVDKLIMYRTYPKPTTAYGGVGRSSIKLQKTMTLTGQPTATGLGTVEVNQNFPVGCAPADIDTFMADLASYFTLQAAKDLAKSLKVLN